MLIVKTKNNPPHPQDIKKKILENKKEERNLAEQRGTLSIVILENGIIFPARDGEAEAY